MSRNTTETYLEKDAAIRWLQGDPDRVLYGYPMGKGKVYRYRYNQQVREVEVCINGWHTANGSWDRAVKFSELKYKEGYTGVKRAQRRIYPHSPVTVGVPMSASSSLQEEKLRTVNALLESVKQLLLK